MTLTLGSKLVPIAEQYDHQQLTGRDYKGPWPMQIIDGPWDDTYDDTTKWVVRYQNGAIEIFSEEALGQRFMAAKPPEAQRREDLAKKDFSAAYAAAFANEQRQVAQVSGFNMNLPTMTEDPIGECPF